MNNNKLNSLINSYQKSNEKINLDQSGGESEIINLDLDQSGGESEIINLDLDQSGGESDTETLDNIDLLYKMLINEDKNDNEYTKSLLKEYINSEDDKKIKRIYINYK
jgi:hypothetical protein